MLSGLVSSHTWSPFVLRRLQDSGKWSLITKHGSVACTRNLEEKQGNVPTIHVASPNLQVISSAKFLALARGKLLLVLSL